MKLAVQSPIPAGSFFLFYSSFWVSFFSLAMPQQLLSSHVFNIVSTQPSM